MRPGHCLMPVLTCPNTWNTWQSGHARHTSALVQIGNPRDRQKEGTTSQIQLVELIAETLFQSSSLNPSPFLTIRVASLGSAATKLRATLT